MGAMTVLSLLAVALLGASDAEVRAADEAWALGQYEDVLPHLATALTRPLNREDRARAYELMAMTHAAFGKSPAAIEAFRGLLALKPDYRTPADASPKLAGLLEAARRAGPASVPGASEPLTLTPSPEPNAGPVTPAAELTAGSSSSAWWWVVGAAAAVVTAGAVTTVVLVTNPAVPSGTLGRRSLK